MKIKKLNYYFFPDHVCSECGGQKYHINLRFVMPDMVMHEDEECNVWCHDCECEVNIVEPKEKDQ